MSANGRYMFVLLVLAAAAFPLVCFAADATVQETGVQLKQLQVSEEAVTYSRMQYTRPVADAFFALVVYGFILQSGWAARLRTAVENKVKVSLLRVPIYYFCVSCLAFVGCLPYYYFYSHWLPTHYDLSQMSDLQWFIERCKRFLVNATLGGIYWTLFFLLVAKFKRTWHLILFGLLAPLTAFFVFIWPVAVDPLFNEFSNLPRGELRTRIEGLAGQAGIPDAEILVADKSRQTKELNAYVTGIGPSARIVMWDTILAGMPENELITVVGHEIGHYVLLHVYKGYALSMLALLAGLLAAGRWAPVVLRKLPRAWGVTDITDLTIIPVVVLMTAPAVLISSPLESSVSRVFEHEADAYALTLVKKPVSMANAFMTLAQKDLIDPNPPGWIEFWFFSHPSLAKRIEFALHGTESGPKQ